MTPAPGQSLTRHTRLENHDNPGLYGIVMNGVTSLTPRPTCVLKSVHPLRIAILSFAQASLCARPVAARVYASWLRGS